MNEELQSTNEELETINDELRERTGELNQVNAFLEAILTSLGLGVAVLDAHQRIQVWNRRAEDLWGLRADEARRAALPRASTSGCRRAARARAARRDQRRSERESARPRRRQPPRARDRLRDTVLPLVARARATARASRGDRADGGPPARRRRTGWRATR